MKLFSKILILFLVNSGIVQAQPPNTFPALGRAGIQTATPLKLLEITSGNGIQAPGEDDPTIRFSYHHQIGVNRWDNAAHISLLTLLNLNYYTSLPQQSPGDIVIQATDSSHDIIITTLNDTGRVIIATSPSMNQDKERIRVMPDGTIGFNLLPAQDPIGQYDFNLRGWNENMPRIVLNQTGADPSLRFYKPTGNVSSPYESFPWWMENHNGRLFFRSNDGPPFYADMGSETPNTRVSFHYNGNVGINKEEPTTRLNVENGNVVFEGNSSGDYDNIPMGSGTRFMWVAEKGALRAGEVTDGSWDNSQIGQNSIAFGKDNKAIGAYSASWGNNNEAFGELSTIFGDNNHGNGENSTAWGDDNWVNGNFATSWGRVNHAEADMSTTWGTSNRVYSTGGTAWGFTCIVDTMADYSTAFGDHCIVYQPNSLAAGKEVVVNGVSSIGLGFNAKCDNNNTISIGNNLIASGANSTCLGNLISTAGYNGSFAIGDYLDPRTILQTYPDQQNQIVMRFTGAANDSSLHQKTHRFISAVDEISGNIICESFLTSGSYGLISTSDRNKKKDVIQVNESDVLQRLRNVPVSYYKWKPKTRLVDSILVIDSLSNTWMGPMAQDFYKQFPIGFPDSCYLSTPIMNSAMMASIQALANITDTLKESIQIETNKHELLEKEIDSNLTKSEFESFKDSIGCYLNACERIDNLENQTKSLVTKGQFDSFKDSIRCYADACNRISELERDLVALKLIIDSLRNMGGGLIKEENDNNDNNNILQYAQKDEIILEQNRPNPFDETTEINYYIPSSYSGTTEFIIADEKGNKIIKRLFASIGSPSSLIFSSKEINSGVYLYGILVNNKLIAHKKMMIIK